MTDNRNIKAAGPRVGRGPSAPSAYDMFESLRRTRAEATDAQQQRRRSLAQAQTRVPPEEA